MQNAAAVSATEAQGAQMSAAEAGMYWVGLEEAVLSTQARPQRLRLNEETDWNMEPMSPTLATFQAERSPLNSEASRNIAAMVVTLSTFHLERSPLNDLAASNICCMVVTLSTFQPERSPLNEEAP